MIINTDYVYEFGGIYNKNYTPYNYLLFMKDGTIKGEPHYNETYWKYENGKIIIFDEKWKVTTIFNRINGEYIIGQFILGSNFEHYITKTNFSVFNAIIDNKFWFTKKDSNMHKSQYEITKKCITKYFTKNYDVYDIGSYDVSSQYPGSFQPGNMRQTVIDNENKYIGVDIKAGPNVDIVINEKNWKEIPDNSMKYVISGSCLEHVPAPWKWAELLYKKMKKGGICIIHIPFKISDHKSPKDCYRILPDGLEYLFTEHVTFEKIDCGVTTNELDSYFVGIKK